MKIQYLFPVLGLLLATSCSKPADPNAFVIEGQITKQGNFDGAVMYLIPAEGPHPRPVDSCLIDKEGKFHFEGNHEQVSILRMDIYHRLDLQELLLCTEPGTTIAEIGEVSKSYGSPQNNLLQNWKERTAIYHKDIAACVKYYNEHKPAMTHDEFMVQADSVSSLYTNDVCQWLKEQGRCASTIFIYKTILHIGLDSLLQKDLDVMLKDTVDWSKPQPGYHL